ncbi:Uncharacterised protein [Alloiococcus otitis]|uniref:hypothetical protein n=1 Tax=Alloiococcus otitis TaxID=1652 RepID=UPI000E1AB701|nr:hypothetical protein [Alloiococcus otitis]SUU80708.1 Uncharacterised protein [Alloiococcus otitis]
MITMVGDVAEQVLLGIAGEVEGLVPKVVQLAPAIAGVGASFLVLGEAFPILNTIGLGMDLVSNKVSAFRDGAIRGFETVNTAITKSGGFIEFLKSGFETLALKA